MIARLFLPFLSAPILLASTLAKADSLSLPSELAYSVNGSCADGNISFRALTALAHDESHTRTADVVVYLNQNGTGAVSVNTQAPIATRWSFLPSPAAPDILNIRVESIGTIQYISARVGGEPYPSISLSTENSDFPNVPTLPAGEGVPAFLRNVPQSIGGQTPAAYCGH